MKHLNLILIILAAIILFGCGSVGAVGTYPAVDPSMVLYYHFNNQSAYGENDTHVYDFSGNGNNGTANNTQFQAGTGILNDGSLYFNGVNSSIINNNINTTGGSFTISFWVLINSSRPSAWGIMQGSNSTGTSLGDWNIYALAGQTNLNFRTYNKSGTEFYYAFNSTISFNSWNFYTVTYDSSSKILKVYFNGLLKSSNTITGGIQNNFTGIRISKYYDGASARMFNGSIDDLIIRNKSLSSYDVLIMYDDYLDDYTNLPISSNILYANNKVKNIGLLDYIDFSKGNAYIDLRNQFISWNDSFTVSYWIKFNAYNSDPIYGLNGNNWYSRFMISPSSIGVSVGIKDNLGSYNTNYESYPTDFVLNRWFLVSILYEKNRSVNSLYTYGNNVNVYINGYSLGGFNIDESNINNSFSLNYINYWDYLGANTSYNISIKDVDIYPSWYGSSGILGLYNKSQFGDNYVNSAGTGIPIVYYHNINGTKNPSDTITTLYDTFTQEMDWLNASGFHTINMTQYYNYKIYGTSLPSKPILINFDDGFLGVLTLAKPYMDKYNFTGNIPVPIQAVGTSGQYDYIPGTNWTRMNWTQLKNLSDSGWMIISHGQIHWSMNNMNATQRLYEFNQSRYDMNASIGVFPLDFVFPITNNQNQTLLDECALYYRTCSGLALPVPTFNYDSDSVIGYKRMAVTGTSFNSFKSIDNLNLIGLKVNSTNIYTPFNSSITCINCSIVNENGTYFLYNNVTNPLIYWDNLSLLSGFSNDLTKYNLYNISIKIPNNQTLYLFNNYSLRIRSFIPNNPFYSSSSNYIHNTLPNNYNLTMYFGTTGFNFMFYPNKSEISNNSTTMNISTTMYNDFYVFNNYKIIYTYDQLLKNGYTKLNDPFWSYTTEVINNTLDMANTIPIQGLTSALLSNGTSLCNGSYADLSLNTGTINITLRPNEYGCVFDNANLTEGLNRSSGNCIFPLDINTQGKSKHITNSLDTSINALTLIDLGDCDTKNLITYTTDKGIVSTYKGQDAKNYCNSLKLGVVLQIDPSLNSNILTWEDGSTNLSGVILKILITILGLILVVAVLSIFAVYLNNNFNDVPAIDLIKSMIVFLIVEILIIALMEYTASIL